MSTPASSARRICATVPVDVGGQRVGHGLHRDRRAVAHRHAADMDAAGLPPDDLLVRPIAHATGSPSAAARDAPLEWGFCRRAATGGLGALAVAAASLPSLIRSGSSGRSRRTAPLPPSDGAGHTVHQQVGAAGIAGGQQQVRLGRHLPGLARMQDAVQQHRAGAVAHLHPGVGVGAQQRCATGRPARRQRGGTGRRRGGRARRDRRHRRRLGLLRPAAARPGAGDRATTAGGWLLGPARPARPAAPGAAGPV